MLDAQYAMDWRPSSPKPLAPSLRWFASIPFDIFLELVRKLDVWDLVQLRQTCKRFNEFASVPSVWIVLAETIIARRPIPLPPFRTHASLSPRELEVAVCRAARLEKNWLSHFGRLRAPPRVLCEPGRTHGDILVVLPGGRYLVTGASSAREDGVGGVLSVWDLAMGTRLATFEVRIQDDVLQWRPVDGGRAVMFLVRDGVLSTSSSQHFHLLRLEFTEGLDCTSASFYHHSSLTQDLPIADTSLSEDVVLVLAVDNDNTITMFVLHWRNGTMVSIKTGIHPPEHPYFAILSLDQLSIWVDSPSDPVTYSFPLSAIFPHLAYPARPPIFLPQPTPTILKHVSNISPSPPPGFVPLYRDTTRMWATGPNSPFLSRPLSILHVASYQDVAARRTITCLSHDFVPTKFTSHPTDRTYFSPLCILSSAVSVSEDGMSAVYPIIAAEAANIVFPEVLPSGEAQMRVMTLPPDDPAFRRLPPEWYSENLIRTLQTPSELDLNAIVMMSLDEAAGVLAVAVDGGDIFILQY